MTMQEFIEKAKAAKAAQQNATQNTNNTQNMNAEKFRELIARLKAQKNQQN